MTQENLVLEYSAVGLPIANGSTIRLYEDGKIEVIGIGSDLNTGENVHGKTLKELRVSPEKIKSYAERLIEEGFYDYEQFPSFVLDGLVETMTLNYKGRFKKIDSGNQIHHVLFPEIVREIKALLEEFE